MNNSHLSQTLLALKVCHDLSAPIGAINLGISMVEDQNGKMDDITLDLIKKSTETAANKISFYRTAFSNSTNEESPSIRQALQATQEYYAHEKIEFIFSDLPEMFFDIPEGHWSRLLLNIILFTAEGLFRGGKIHVKILNEKKEFQPIIELSGTDFRLKEESLQAFEHQISLEQLTSRLIQPYYTQLLSKTLNVRINLQINDQSAPKKVIISFL